MAHRGDSAWGFLMTLKGRTFGSPLPPRPQHLAQCQPALSEHLLNDLLSVFCTWTPNQVLLLTNSAGGAGLLLQRLFLGGGPGMGRWWGTASLG